MVRTKITMMLIAKVMVLQSRYLQLYYVGGRGESLDQSCSELDYRPGSGRMSLIRGAEPKLWCQEGQVRFFSYPIVVRSRAGDR